jgi:hypothetical protein
LRDLIQPAEHVDEALVVDVGRVARVEPAAVQGSGGLVGELEIFLQQARAPRDQLTDCPDLHDVVGELGPGPDQDKAFERTILSR